MQTERWTKVGARDGGWSAVAPWSGRRGALTGSVSGPPRRVRLLFRHLLYFCVFGESLEVSPTLGSWYTHSQKCGDKKMYIFKSKQFYPCLGRILK
jgi:hypothetical protein